MGRALSPLAIAIFPVLATLAGGCAAGTPPGFEGTGRADANETQGEEDSGDRGDEPRKKDDAGKPVNLDPDANTEEDTAAPVADTGPAVLACDTSTKASYYAGEYEQAVATSTVKSCGDGCAAGECCYETIACLEL